ncbi:MAG: methyltransferase domain-containing protein [Lachnospiraceae bacterium]|nr:methyltransferase domain-containing protein [Lachnospiraceae bacterium]
MRKELVELRDRIRAGKETLEDSQKQRFIALLEDQDPKVRRLAMQIIGAMKWDDLLENMFLTYQKEETLFVRPDYLLAMGQLTYDKFLPELKNCLQEISEMDVQEDVKVHLEKERKILKELIVAKEGIKRHSFAGLQKETEILLTTRKGLEDITKNQIQGMPKKLFPHGVMVKTADIDDLLQLRTYEELLFYMGEVPAEEDSAKLKDLLAEKKIGEFIKECHREKHPMGVRISLESSMEMEKRGAFIRHLWIGLMDCYQGEIYDATTGYEAEIRLVKTVKDTYRVFVKLFTLPRNPFDYRKESIATSLKPYMAANLVQLGLEYMKEGAQILDPFCGVGTLLVERRMALYTGDTYGVDTFMEAIEKARKNCEKVGPNIHFIQRDFADFTHAYKFDEIITDMPRGSKMVTREELKRDYELLFTKGEELLNEKGRMFVYGNEHGFMKQQLRRHKNFKLLKDRIISEKLDTHFYVIEYM